LFFVSYRLSSSIVFPVQSLASPAYLHFLATNTTAEGRSLLLDHKFKAFLRYLQTTWSQPQYSRFIRYPHSLYFLDLLIKNDAFCRELAQVNFRNFCHQQQYVFFRLPFSATISSSMEELRLSAPLPHCEPFHCPIDTIHGRIGLRLFSVPGNRNSPLILQKLLFHQHDRTPEGSRFRCRFINNKNRLMPRLFDCGDYIQTLLFLRLSQLSHTFHVALRRNLASSLGIIFCRTCSAGSPRFVSLSHLFQ